MGAAVSVPSEHIWFRWEVVFDLMEIIGGPESCMCWEAVLAATRGFWTLEIFEAVTGMAWRDLDIGYVENIMKTNQPNTRAQRPSETGKDTQSPDEHGARPNPNSKPTQSRYGDPMSMDSTSLGRVIIKVLENVICKPFADKLDRGWDSEAMHAPLLDVLEPRKAMEELAIDMGNHMKQNPRGAGADFIKKYTEAENQFWTLNSAEECEAFRRRQRAEKILRRKEARRGKRPSGDKQRKEGANVQNSGIELGSDPAEAGL